MKEDKQAVSQEWLERKILLEILNQGAMTVNDLIMNMRERQKKLSALGQKVPAHSDNTLYMRWVSEFRDTHIVIDNGARLLLTPLGKWLLGSTCISTLRERYLFITKITCEHCHRAGNVSVLMIRPNTAEKDPRSRMLVMNVECPKCRIVEKKPMTETLTASQFSNLYNLVLSDMKKNVRFMPQLVLPR
jgi:ssDNA-binding Zn-finger/Zn-ribbon topoisomerase 1